MRTSNRRPPFGPTLEYDLVVLWVCVRHWSDVENHAVPAEIALDSHATLKALPPEVRGGEGIGHRQLGLPLCFVCQWVSGDGYESA